MTIDNESISRFEYLAGRFFDGSLDEHEDQELAGILKADGTLAERFLEQARIERLIGYGSDPARLSDEAFADTVMRSIAFEDPVESERFAHNVVRAVRENVGMSTSRRLSLRSRRRIQRPSHMPQTIVMAVAAALALALLLALASGPSSPRRVAHNEPVRVETINLTVRQAVDDAAAPGDSAAAPRARIEATQDEAPALQTFTDAQKSDEGRSILPVEIPAAAQAKAEEKQAIVSAPAQLPKASTAAAASVQRTGGKVMAQLAKLNNVKAVRIAAGSKEEKPLAEQAMLSDGDTLRVLSPDISASEALPGSRHAELIMGDGSQLVVSEGATLLLAMEGAAPRPVLERGEVLARIRPQIPGSNLIIKTKQGAEAAVLGTVFTLKADTGNRRVELRVDEGKVQFSNKGEKRLVVADEACVAEDGKIPSQPFAFRPRPAILAGVLTDKETGRPIPNATITVAPYAERQKALPHLGTKTDAQGRFTIENLREGLSFILAKTDDGGPAGLQGRGTIVRTRLTGGEKNMLNISMEKGAVAVGKLYEPGGKTIVGATVRLVPPASDGQSMDLKVTQNGTQTDWSAVALEGNGKYLAIVEKPGFIARIKNMRLNDIRSHIVTNWPLEVQLAPSAVLKGRVLNPSGLPITDPPGANLLDPRLPRTIVTLAASSGTTWSAEAEADGTFVFNTNLDSGAYDIKIERFGFAPLIKRINLVAGQTLELPATLDFAKAAAR